MDLIDFRLVFTQILGFLILLWALNKWAFGPLLGMLEARRATIPRKGAWRASSSTRSRRCGERGGVVGGDPVKDTVVAGRYAKGLFLFTEKRGETAGALADLLGLRAVLEPGSAAERFLASPVVLPAEKRRALEQGLGGRVLRSVVLFLDLLLRKKRM